MMHPRLYRAACSALLGLKVGEVNDPETAEDEPYEKYERLRNTKEVYRILFGHVATSKLWTWSFEPVGVMVPVKHLTGKTLRLHVDLKESVAYFKMQVEVGINID